MTGSTHVNGSKDVFVTKFNVTREVIYHKTFGGPGDDWGHRIIADGDGCAYVVGEISHDGLKVADAFISKIDPSGNEVKRTLGVQAMTLQRALPLTRRATSMSLATQSQQPSRYRSLRGGTVRVAGTSQNATLITDWTYHGDTMDFLPGSTRTSIL